MADGTVKVTAEAHLHIGQLLNLIQGPLGDVLSQITSHGLALTDPAVWEGPAASLFSQQVWPGVQQTLDTVRGTLMELQQQVGGVIGNFTNAGSGLPVLGSLTQLPVAGQVVGSLLGGASVGQ